jgi:cysteine-rich repeat protein
VKVDMLGINKDIDAGPHTIKAAKFVGDGSGLTGVGAAGFSQGFSKVFAGGAGVAIPDDNPIGVSDVITVPTLGAATSVTVSVSLENSDMSTVEVVLFDPNNSKMTLLPFGAGAGGTWSATFPNPTPLASGSLDGWLGQDPAGKWTLGVVDQGFKDNGVDGQIVSWSLSFGFDSNSKVQNPLTIVAAGGLMLPESDGPPVPCDADHRGYSYIDTGNAGPAAGVYICLGWWAKLALEAVCGNGGVETGETCDDGNGDDTDACPTTCQTAVCGDGFVHAGVEECDDGAANNGDGKDQCRASCKNPTCGDGVVDTGEACDDGNEVDGDTCSNQCTSNKFVFQSSQAVKGKTVTCSSVVTNNSYTQCTNLKVDGLYMPNGITCGPSWSFSFASKHDPPGFCQFLTGVKKAEAYYKCSGSTTRAEWENGGWTTGSDNGYIESLRCYYQ